MLPDDSRLEELATSTTHLSPAGLRRAATILYTLFGVAAIVWVRVRTGSWWPASVPGRDVGASAALGAATAGVTVALTAWLLLRARATTWLARQIRTLIGSPDRRTALELALLSGIGEELFFRGAMQPAVGYVLTSIVFGLLHTGPDRRFLLWTAFALVLGFALGGILEWTGSLVGPVLAHVAINYINLRKLGRMEAFGEELDPIGTLRAASEEQVSFENRTDSPESEGGES